MIIITDQGALMDIIDAKPTCGCMSRFFAHSDAACVRTPGHTGRHRATSGGEWDDDMAVWPTPRKAVDYLRSERDAYAKQVETITKERDAYKARWELCEATSKKQDEALTAAGLAMDHLAKERDLARSELDLCTGRLQTAIDEVAELRDLLAAEKQQVEEWRFTAANREKVTAMATGAFMNAQQETELLRASLDATQAELEKARQAADEWAANAREYERAFGPLVPAHGPMLRADDVVAQPAAVWWPCPRSKAKQVGSSSYVIRRCKLADGHDGMCEPA